MSEPTNLAEARAAEGQATICACLGCPHARNCHCFCTECYQEYLGNKPRTPDRAHSFGVGGQLEPFRAKSSGVPD